jgi:hypothetical protein
MVLSCGFALFQGRKIVRNRNKKAGRARQLTLPDRRAQERLQDTLFYPADAHRVV